VYIAPPPEKKGHGCLIALIIALVILIAGAATIWLMWPKISQSDLYLAIKNGKIIEYFTGGDVGGDDSASGNYTADVDAEVEELQWQGGDYTDLLPKPDFGSGYKDYTYEGSFKCSLTGATFEEVAAYVQKIKDAGFTKDPSEEVYESLSVYTYSASNASGQSVSMSFFTGLFEIEITK